MKRRDTPIALAFWVGLAIVIGGVLGAGLTLGCHAAAAYIEAKRHPAPVIKPAEQIQLPADVTNAIELLQQLLQAAGHYQKT